MYKKLSLFLLLLSSPIWAKTVSSVSISPQAAALKVGSSQQLTVTCNYDDTSTDDCTAAGGATWSSSTARMTVSGSGLATWVTDPGVKGVPNGFAVVKVVGLNDKAAVYGQHVGDTWYQYITPDSRIYKTMGPGPIVQLPLNVVVGSTVALGAGVLANNSGSATGVPFQGACNWTSSDPTKATIDRLGHVTAISTGAVTMTCGIVGDAVFGSSTVGGWQTQGRNIDLAVVSGGTSNVTWYVRQNGGTPFTNSTATPFGQCTGLTDADYPGTTAAIWQPYTSYALNTQIVGPNGHYQKVTGAGVSSSGPPGWTTTGTVTDGTVTWTAQGLYPVNQACAMGTIRYLWSDETTYTSHAWLILGGDTVIVRQNPNGYNTGLEAPGGQPSWTPTNCAGDGSLCRMPPIPSGTSSRHTKFLGENFASCHSDSAKTILNETYGSTAAFDLTDSQYVDVACFEITDKAQCANSGNYANACGNLPTQGRNAGAFGVLFSALSASDNLTDLYIHGLGSDGLHGAVGTQVVVDHIHIRAMPNAGINMDDNPWGQGNISVAGGFTLTNSVTEWTGCVEEYPVAHTYPYLECRDQNTGAYGDGFGTASTSGDWVFDHDTWLYNYSDGLDLLHSGMKVLTITNSTSEGNIGQAFKLGSGNAITFRNNLSLTNCDRVGQLIGDEPISSIVPNATTQPTFSSSSLAISYTAGIVVASPGAETTSSTASASFTLAPNATNYVWLDPTTLTIQHDTTHTVFDTLTAQFKIASIVTNDVGVVANGYSTYNTGVSLCRANDGIPVSIDELGATTLQNNTYVGYQSVTYDLNCAGGWDSCTHSNTTFQNNVNIGITNPSRNAGQSPGLFFLNETQTFPPNQGWTVRDHNLFFGFKGGCPTLTATEVCVDAAFIHEPPTTITDIKVLDGYNFNLSATSPAKFTGLAVSGLTLDNVGHTYNSPPSMGALEYQVGTLLTVTVTPGTASMFVGKTAPLTAACAYSNGENTPCTIVWTDTGTHSSVGSTTGIVTGITAGPDTITATMNSVFGTATVTINNLPPVYYLQGGHILGRLK